ncbi:hypothetical protein NBRC10512_004770 [Rhodotorula toruloides]|uniref:RHTO0S03e05028g1_1 n=2 Tax=Rhodotorula toruloides TaxID=5286 RepID=A0A061AS22_RHOTO|nr:calcium/calmodulin-dependent protein kinase kinase [Rhodotorula toruloides NP11]EMS25829.1 calcium/calmodulin-dependent protein kinase kinase [Rhodotorula toruloides NP11]KAJ8295985.1 Serine/threonine-protein kinase ssp1 [Rhodotorula toruloides]CDR38171.1 RHTO0S03e05028g1_1 [Rhodotorula toruloides]
MAAPPIRPPIDRTSTTPVPSNPHHHTHQASSSPSSSSTLPPAPHKRIPSSLSRSSRIDSLAAVANRGAPAGGTAATGEVSPRMLTSSRSHSSLASAHAAAMAPQGRGTKGKGKAKGYGGGGNESYVVESSHSSTRSSTSTTTSATTTTRPAQTRSTVTRDRDGFVVTSRPKYWQPPPNSPGPPAIMAANPFYRSSPSSSRANSRANSTNTSANNSASSSRANSRERARRQQRELADKARAALLAAGAVSPPLGTRRGSSPAALTGIDPANAPKTTLHLSSSIDSKGRRMVNQYVRLKTIGQGSHGKVWLCAEPSVPEEGEDDEVDIDEGEEKEELADETERAEGTSTGRSRRRRKRTPSERWEADIDAGRVKYCAIKSVAREGPGGPKGSRSLRLAAQSKTSKKASTQESGGIGADDKVKREVAIMKRLDHPNIVRLKEVIDDAKSKKVFMVLEFMAGGQIVWQDDNKQPTMTVDEARRTFRDVVLGLEYLHYQGIIHRDIKPANLLWTEDHSTVKISDFGVSHVSEALLRCSPDDDPVCEGDDEKALRKTAGSPAFFAPELCFPVEWHAGGAASIRGMGLYATRDSRMMMATNATSRSMDTYFPRGIEGAHLTPSSGGAAYSPPTSPNGIPLSSVTISAPLPPTSPNHPRTRPPVGKGIDIWALGVTLYCLLFGDTPFNARTEYELYNVIVKEGIRVPERMGREGQWTGVGKGWDGAGDGVEGRETVDLLGRLLEKDPTKRITLEEVKKHPWVLRNLSNPESWLRATDPAKIHHVTITDEDVQHATQERGRVASIPPIRNRPGIRRALNAALAKFPAFARIKSTRTSASTNSDEMVKGGAGRRSRSKSNSSGGHGFGGAWTAEPSPALASTSVPSTTVSRQPSDGGGAPLKSGKSKHSYEHGVDLRRIISGSGAHESSSSGAPRSPSPVHGHRGGWAARRKVTPSDSPSGPSGPTSPNPLLTSGFPELSRSVSTSSIMGSGTTSGSRSAFSNHFFSRKPSDSDTTGAKSANSSIPSPAARSSGFSPSPWAGSDTESNANGKSGRSISRMLGRLSGGDKSSGATSTTGSIRSRSDARERESSRQLSGSTEDSFDAGIAPGLVERLEAAGTTRDQYDALGRLVVGRKGSAGSTSTHSRRRASIASGRSAARAELDATDGEIDLTEFEYSDSDDYDDDDDDLDDFMRPPIAHADHFSGWKQDFGDFKFGVRSPSDDANVGRSVVEDYALSPAGTPPTDELDALEEEDGKIGTESTPSAAAASRPHVSPLRDFHVPYADAVSFQLCPLDIEEYMATPRGSVPVSTPSGATATSATSPTPLAIPPAMQPVDCPPRIDTGRAHSPRDGSIRGVSLDPPSPRKAHQPALGQWDDEDCDGEEEEILVVPRRRRAATLSGNPPTSPR